MQDTDNRLGKYNYEHAPIHNYQSVTTFNGKHAARRATSIAEQAYYIGKHASLTKIAEDRYRTRPRACKRIFVNDL